jgi:hypothetical protein
MIPKPGTVERVEAIIARQRHGKHVSATTDTDATTEYAVFSKSPLLDNCTVSTFPQQRINRKQYRIFYKHCFLCGPPRDYITCNKSQSVVSWKRTVAVRGWP